MHIRRCRVEQDWSTRPRLQTETKTTVDSQHILQMGRLSGRRKLMDTLFKSKRKEFSYSLKKKIRLKIELLFMWNSLRIGGNMYVTLFLYFTRKIITNVLW